jgi:hypothetical protein
LICSLGIRHSIRLPIVAARYAIRFSEGVSQPPLKASTFFFPPIKTSTNKPDVSLLIADIKLTPTGDLKIVEFGHGIHSGLEGYGKVNNQHQLMKSVWQYYCEKRQFQLFYIGDSVGYSRYDKLRRGLDYINQQETSFILSKKDLRPIVKSYEFCDKSGIDRTKMESYLGLVVDVNYSGNVDYTSLLNRNSNLLMLNGHSGLDSIVSDKFLTNNLFSKKLESFKPKWVLKQKRYTENLAGEILDELKSEKLIIKPLSLCRGKGIIVTTKQQLDDELRNVLIGNDEIQTYDFMINKNLEEYNYYQNYNEFYNDGNPFFLVEEYVESKPIQTEDGQFDGTLRMVFSLENATDYACVHHFDGYWKLPKQAIGTGALNDSCKSLGSDYSHKLSTDDRDHVISKLNVVLPEIYETMITTTPYATAKTLLNSESEHERKYGKYMMSMLEEILTSRR